MAIVAIEEENEEAEDVEDERGRALLAGEPVLDDWVGSIALAWSDWK